MGNNVNKLEVATIGPHKLIPMYLSFNFIIHGLSLKLALGKTDVQLLSVLFEDSFWGF